jgi:hypothetical protein
VPTFGVVKGIEKFSLQGQGESYLQNLFPVWKIAHIDYVSCVGALLYLSYTRPDVITTCIWD